VKIRSVEYAGTVAALGPGVTSVAVGDPVMGIVGGGGMATHVVVHEREIMKVPRGLSLEHAAAVPEVFLTAYDALIVQARVGLRTTVLIHSAASGVGTAAMQLVHVAGGVAIGTSRTQSKLDRLDGYGLSHGILVDGACEFARATQEVTGGAGAQVILDTVGGAYLTENVRALAHRGHIIIIGLLGGIIGSTPLGVLLGKRATITGTLLRSRPLEDKAALAQQFSAQVSPLFGTGALEPVIDEVMPMDEVARAHERLEANETFGKIVLRW